jgi:hypothetical protein
MEYNGGRRNGAAADGWRRPDLSGWANRGVSFPTAGGSRGFCRSTYVQTKAFRHSFLSFVFFLYGFSV